MPVAKLHTKWCQATLEGSSSYPHNTLCWQRRSKRMWSPRRYCGNEHLACVYWGGMRLRRLTDTPGAVSVSVPTTVLLAFTQ